MACGWKLSGNFAVLHHFKIFENLLPAPEEMTQIYNHERTLYKYSQQAKTLSTQTISSMWVQMKDSVLTLGEPRKSFRWVADGTHLLNTQSKPILNFSVLLMLKILSINSSCLFAWNMAGNTFLSPSAVRECLWGLLGTICWRDKSVGMTTGETLLLGYVAIVWRRHEDPAHWTWSSGLPASRHLVLGEN